MRLWPKHDPDWKRAPAPENADLDKTVQPWIRRFALPAPHGSPQGRLLFISDLHWASRDADAAQGLLARLRRLDPDWVVFGGDLIEYLANVEAAFRILGQIAARQGKFAVLGNREAQFQWLPLAFWRERYAAAGFHLLHNTVQIGASPETPTFVGLDDCRHGEPALHCAASLQQSDRLVILATHSPDAVTGCTGHFVGHLVLAGHTHGGQLRLPALGPLYTSSTHWRQFDTGWYRRRSDDARMYITTGLGITGFSLFRRRLFCAPECVVLDLIPARPATPHADARRGDLN